MKHRLITSTLKGLLVISILSSVTELQAQITNVFPSSGNVGIGTTAPSVPLDIAKPSIIVLRARNTATTGDGSSIFDMANSSGNYWRTVVGGANNGLGLTTGQYYIERAGSGVRFLIDGTTGNVLINKITQVNTSYKLDVAGKIRANEIVVNTTGADFVFADNYKLNGLKEVELFVKKNKHLPEIPSAAEMTEQGMEVGELTKRLLQKVEELTLYIIEQQKQIDALKALTEK